MNKVILMGRLTKDPELRYTTANNVPVCSFTIAVDRQFARQGEEKQADFFPVVVWNKTAEFCSKYFNKGQKVALVGRLQTRTWDDNEGKKHYITEVVAEEAHFAESKKAEGYGNPGGRPMDDVSQPSAGFYPVEEDDDLPF